jgi:hypothetical protein
MKKLLHRDEKNTSFQHYTNIRRFCDFFCKNIPPKVADIKMFFYFCRDKKQSSNHEKVCCCLFACAVRPACVVLGLLPGERGRRHAVLQPL